MSIVSTSSSSNIIQHDYSRKLLLQLHSSIHKLSFPPPATAAVSPSALHDTPQPYAPVADSSTRFDTNVVMVLSVLLCALIFSLGLNSIIRCAFKCSRLLLSDDDHRSSSSSSSSTSASVSSSGVNRKAVKSFMVVQFSPDLNLPGLDSECIICLSDFAAGDKLRLLPKCNHGFHVKCIDKWLSNHSSCPKCRHCLVHTCLKIADASASLHPPPPPPLDHEPPLRNFWL